MSINMNQYTHKIEKIIEEIGKVVVGKEEIIQKVFTAILAQGHILIEDIPGVGKTTLAVAFSKTMELDYRRIQFTPDVLPTDVVGFTVLNQENEFEYKQGAVLCNLFLADEINRTSSKTQSALLEVMEEGNVTIDGNTWEVPKPFAVIATQNPVGSIGTHMLPESQLDRFMIKISVGYPDPEQEIRMLKERHTSNPLDFVNQIITIEELLAMQAMAEKVYVHDIMYVYLTNLVAATRQHSYIELGVSPRGTIALMAMTKAVAFMNGRDYVIPEDIKFIFRDVVEHRLVLNQKAKVNHARIEMIIEELLASVPVPKVRLE